MKPTPRETAAAHALANALLEFALATEEGRATRQPPRRAASTIAVGPGQRANPKEPERLLLTASQAAAFLSIGRRTLWGMSAPRGPLATVHLGKAVRYPLEELRKAIDAMTIKGKESDED